MYKAKVKYNGEHYFCGEIVRGSKIDKLKDGSTWLYDDEEIDWVDNEQDKWEICYKDSNDGVKPAYNIYYRAQAFNIYFTSLEIAKEAIKKIGEDRIKKYYFDIED